MIIMQKGNINGSWEINKNYWNKIAINVPWPDGVDGVQDDNCQWLPWHGNPRATHRLICMKNYAVYRDPLYICCLYKYDASNPYAHMHNCHPFCPHTHPLWQPSCVGLNENGACWPNERELFTYVVRMCGRWEGRAVSIYTTYADPIKAKEGSKKQTTNNFWGRFGVHTHTETFSITKNGCNACRGLLLAFCLVPCSLCSFCCLLVQHVACLASISIHA